MLTFTLERVGETVNARRTVRVNRYSPEEHVMEVARRTGKHMEVIHDGKYYRTKVLWRGHVDPMLDAAPPILTLDSISPRSVYEVMEIYSGIAREEGITP